MKLIAAYLFQILNYIKYKDRIGKNPYFFELSQIQSFDIDWEEDFKLAEKIYMTFENII